MLGVPGASLRWLPGAGRLALGGGDAARAYPGGQSQGLDVGRRAHRTLTRSHKARPRITGREKDRSAGHW